MIPDRKNQSWRAALFGPRWMIIPFTVSLIFLAIAIATTFSGESPPSYIWFSLMTILLAVDGDQGTASHDT